MKIVVVSPHRDDAAFSLTLSICAWLENGHDVAVVNCFTKSNYAPFDAGLGNGANEKWQVVAAQRAYEDESWVKEILRIQTSTKAVELFDLSLWDAPFRLSCSEDVVCNVAPNPADESLEQMRSAVKSLNGDALIIPLALGGHVDHLTARNAILYGEGLRVAAFYEDLPYATRSGVIDNIDAAALEMDSAIMPAFVTGPKEPSFAKQTKMNSALCYRSQIDLETAERMARFSERYQGRERLWANPSREVWSQLFLCPEAGARVK